MATKTKSKPKFEICAGKKAGEHFFRLRAANGEIIAMSETYTSVSDAKRGAKAVKSAAAVAEIVEAEA